MWAIILLLTNVLFATLLCSQFPTELANKKNVILTPKARLYAGVDEIGGDFEDFNFDLKANPNCLDLTKKVTTLNTFGTCVRLYTHPNCLGKSMAFYPTSKSTSQDDTNDDKSNRQQFLTKNVVKAIGPCFENELDDSTTETLKMAKNSNHDQQQQEEGEVTMYKKLKGKNGLPIIPDFVDLGYRGANNRSVEIKSDPINFYRIGHNGRVEYVVVFIAQNESIHHSAQNHDDEDDQFVTKKDQHFYDHNLDKIEGDQLGHFVGFVLGPQKNLPFHNIFPQTTGNRKLLTKLEQGIVQWLRSADDRTAGDNDPVQREVDIVINMDYDSETSTRPSGMSYLTLFNQFDRRVIYLTNQSV